MFVLYIYIYMYVCIYVYIYIYIYTYTMPFNPAEVMYWLAITMLAVLETLGRSQLYAQRFYKLRAHKL